MLRREKITEQVQADLKFLPDKWDRALLGYVERGGPGRHVLPCYGYQAAKAILKGIGYTPQAMYPTWNKTVSSMRGNKPLTLYKYNNRELWKRITEGRLPRWELLDTAIIGLGQLGWEQKGLVYNKATCVDLFVKSQTSTRSDMLATVDAITRLETNNIPVSLGEYTPWYLTPVQ